MTWTQRHWGSNLRTYRGIHWVLHIYSTLFNLVLLWDSWMYKWEDFRLLVLLLGLGSLLFLCWVSLSNFFMIGYFCLLFVSSHCFFMRNKKNINLQRMNLGAWPTTWRVQRENDSMIQCINLRRQCWYNLVITLLKKSPLTEVLIAGRFQRDLLES